MAGIDTGNDIEDSLPSTVVSHHVNTGVAGQALPPDMACSSSTPDQLLPGDMASCASTRQCCRSASHAATTSSARAGVDGPSSSEVCMPAAAVRHATSSGQGMPHAEHPIACLSHHEITGASGQLLPEDMACSSSTPAQLLPGDMTSCASTRQCSHSASHAATTGSAMAGADEPSSSEDCTPAAAVRCSSQSVPSCEWHPYANKNTKLACFPITIARDRAHDNHCQPVKKDKKEYAGFNTFADLLSYVEYQVQHTGRPCMYERVLTIDTQTYLMFDLDRDLESAMPMPQREQVLRAFLRHLTKLLNSLSCEGEVELKIGVNCQVKQAFHANKLSFHVVVYLPDFSLSKSKRVAKAMNALLLGLDEGDPDYELLIKKTEGAPTSIVDLKPYSNGQLLRMLYNCKLKNVVKVPFKPAFGSSVRISDHLINADPDLRPALQLPLMLLPAMDLSRLPEQLPRDEDRGSRPRRTTIASTALPATQLVDEERQADGPGINYVALRQVILDHQPIKEKLGVKTLGLREHVVEGGYCSFPIDPGQCCDTLRCPYAGRKHDNNMYLVYNPRRQLVSLKCHRDQCSDCKDPHYPLRWAVDDLSAVTDTLFDALSAPSLHMPVEFQEVYDGYTVSTTSPHPKMRPYKAYRDRPLLAIRANMGVGKTEQLAEYLAEVLREQPDLRILVLSYRRMLADKMVNDLQLDFVNYQDISTDDVFCAPRLVVQLDSIFRVERRKYDIVVMDEALSTLLHTCSAIMREPQPVMRHLQWLLQRAGQVIMLDAVVDSFVCQHFIRYLERLKSTTCLWVRNTAVIPCQRQVNLTICKSDHPEDRKALVDHAIQKVLAHVAANRRVYVPCTSKTTADRTFLSIKRELGSTFEVMDMAEQLGQQLAESKQGGSSARGDCGTGGPDGGGGGAGSPDSSNGGAGSSTWWAGGSSPSSSAEGGGGSGGGRSPSSIGAASMASNASGGGKSSGVASGVGGCSRDGGNGDGGSRPHGSSRGNSGDSSDSSGINVKDFKVTEASVRQTVGSATGPAGMVAMAAEGVGDGSSAEAASASALPKPKLHVLLITSDTPDLVRRHVASRFQEVMGKADVAIFSPALSAGSSCSLVGHFTASVCIAENVPAGMGPAVDSALQQWARVRCIGAAGGVGGVQDIFIYDPPSVRGAAGPTDMAGIERFLKETANRKVPYLQPSVCSAAQADDLEYDRSSLAYTCLVGHIYHAHYSMTHYSDIIRRVLDEDYALGPNMTVSTFSGECLQHVKKSAEEQKQMQEQRAAAVCYPAVMQVVSAEEDAKLRAAPAPTDQERQLIHIHLMVSKVLSVPPELCDANFFEHYVGTCFNKEQEVMLRQCRALFRYHYAQQLSVDQMRTAYDQKFKRLAGLPESAIAAAYFKPDTFWQPAIQVAALLDALAPGWRDKGKESEVVFVEAATLNAALATWAERRSDKEYEDLLEQLEDVCPRANQPGASRSGLMQLAGKENVKSAADWVKKLLTAAFGCTLGKVKRSSKRGNKYPLDVTRYTDLAGRYQSGRLYRLCQMLSQGVEDYFKKCSRFVDDLDAVV